MSEPPIFDPCGPPIGPSEQRWERLLRNGTAVGYRRTIGRATMFSKDGYGWSATPIAFDQTLPEATFGGPSIRIFHGDVVEMPYRYDSQEHRELIVIVVSPGIDALYDPASGRVERLSSLWPPPNSAFAQRCHGSVWGIERFAVDVGAVQRALRAEESPGLDMVADAAAVFLLGVVLAGFAQWGLTNEVGPITSLIGGFIASLARLKRWRTSMPYLLSRRWALAMTWRMALLCGLTCTVSGVVLNQSWERCVGLGIAGILFSGLVWILAADIVAWRTGGYAREGRPEKRPGARWD